ncbi:auxin efflux carrier component 1-like [Chenopodium quinoa]|uniref:auxin efflux carrier component 1-like n=1 Tax=Chenopodium quinoa TaxID=63459 RepID=UPI000B76E808|nr:auxin efflux carrier component 1-like [Chenopodium quinoa]
MISWKDLYNVLSNVVPLYVVMISAYGSVKWWKIFSPNEISGINRFVALFAVPLLSIKFISNNNPYAMNFRFIAADTLQKLIVIVILFLWCKLSSRGSLEWCITLFSLSCLPNTLVVGIPLLGGMYGQDLSQSLMVQLSVIQFNVWFPIMLFLFEYRRATVFIVPDEQGTEMNTKSSSSSLECSNKICDVSLEFDEERDLDVGVLPSRSSTKTNDHDNEENSWPTGLLSTSFLFFFIKFVRNDIFFFTSFHIYSDNLIGDLTLTEPSSTSKVEVHVETIVECKPKLTNTLPVPAAGSVMTTRQILIMVCKKLMRNPNFYSSVLALTWSLISFRWHVEIPAMVANSIKIFSDTGLGMSMFSLVSKLIGLFMASQPKIISGGSALAALAAAMRFIVGPTITAATSSAIGLRGTLLQIIIMQAALPQAIVSFVFAQEYNVHPGVLSTAVSFGMLISLPITLVYYILLGICIK